MNHKNKGRAEMKYVKAKAVLPESLIAEIQKYIQGETIYIPNKKRNIINGVRDLVVENIWMKEIKQ